MGESKALSNTAPNSREPLTPAELAQIRRHVQSFAEPDDRKGWAVTLATIALIILTIALYPLCCHYLTGRIFWAAFCACALFRGMIMTRCFVLFHDCFHEAAFATKSFNVMIGKLMGGMVLTDFNVYRMYHMNHHQLIGDEDATQRDVQGTLFWTSTDWNKYSRGQKMLLRFFRDPFVYFFFTSFLLTVGQGLHYGFFLHRLRPGYKLQKPVQGTRRTLWRFFAFGDFAVGTLLMGPGYGAYMLAASWVAAFIGFAIFQLHHYVSGNTYYGVKKEEHNSAVAALEGSTLIDFPDWLHGLYLNIAFHHIHHLNMRVPCYNLKKCHDTLDPRLWRHVPVVGLRRGLASLLLVQYNPTKAAFETFPAYRPLYRFLAS